MTLLESRFRWFAFVVLPCLFGTTNRVSATTQCPVSAATPPPPPMDLATLKDRIILNPLLSSARLTREKIVSHQLPYQSIREEISRSYNTTSLRVAPFITQWVAYAQNSLYLAGFIIFVGVVLPLVMVTLWIFWECCYEVDEEDEEECKYESRFAQFIAWGLAVGIILILLALLAFVAILLTGNSLVSGGVSKGSRAVSMVIPEVGRVRDKAVSEVETTVMGKYDILFQNVYRELENSPVQIELDVNKLLRNNTQAFYSNVSREISSHELIFNQSEILLNHVLSLSSTNGPHSSDATSMLEDFKSNLDFLRSVCSELLSLNKNETSELNAECDELILPLGSVYVPIISSDIGDLGGRFSSNQTRLQRMIEILASEEFTKDPPSIDVYAEYFEEMSQNLIRLANSTTDDYLGKNSSFFSNLTSIMDEVFLLNSSLSLNFPASQNNLMIFLGPRYLSGWNDFRSICTIVFALIILIMGVWLVIAIGRGLFNIYDLYFHGEYPSNLEGVHQSGRTLKKLSFMLTGVCVMSAIFYGVSLVVAGGLGKSCLPNGNFSELLNLVMDDRETWGGIHLLGKVLLSNGSYPLTFTSVIENCRLDRSLYVSIQLENRFDLEEDINISTVDMSKYTADVQELSETINPIGVLSPCAEHQLEVLSRAETLSVEWTDLSSFGISSGLFDNNFIGLAGVGEKLDTMQLALNAASPHLTSAILHNLTSVIERTAGSLSDLTVYLNSSLLPSIRQSAGYLQEALGGNSSSLLNEERVALQDNLRLEVIKASHFNLALSAVRVNQYLSTFTSNAIRALQCDTGSCRTLARLYDQFSSAVCNDVVPGLDLYWSSLKGILILTFCAMFFSLFLASRFIDLKQEKSNKPKKFHVIDSSMRQIRGVSWFLLGFCVNVWLLVAISRDGNFHEVFCSSGSMAGCCPSCVWIFGAVFLVMTLFIGGLSRIYQCIMLHRLSKTVKRVRRYWMDRKKAAQFHGQLVILIVQDLPFLIIAGIYSSRINTLTIPAFFSLCVSILGIASYLAYIIKERNNIINYCLCLKKQLKRSTKYSVQGEHTQGGGDVGGGGSNGQQAIGMNGRALNGRYIGSGSEQSESDSQETTQHVDDWMFNPNNINGHGEHTRLSVIPEYMEGGGELAPPPPPPPPPLLPPQSPIRGGGGGTVGVGRGGSRDVTVPIYVPSLDSDSEIQPVTSMGLDRTNSPTESALQHRRVMADCVGVGIEVASFGQYDTSSTSYFGSKTSMTGSDVQGYYSSSQPPDEHSESSDYREDYDSDYSHTYAQRAKLKLRLHDLPCEMSVDV